MVFREPEAYSRSMKKLILVLTVLTLMSGMTAPCRGKHLRPERLVGTWIVKIDGVDQIVRVRPDLTVDYGVDELEGELRLTADRTLVWDTRGKSTDRTLKLTLVRGCGEEVLMHLVDADVTGGPVPELGQEVSWVSAQDISRPNSEP